MLVVDEAVLSLYYTTERKTGMLAPAAPDR